MLSFNPVDYPWATADWDLIPDHMRQPFYDYVMNGIPPGSFLGAVLANDLMGAIGAADSTNIHRLHSYATFIYNYAPDSCHGNPNLVKEWIRRGGVLGIKAKAMKPMELSEASIDAAAVEYASGDGPVFERDPGC